MKNYLICLFILITYVQNLEAQTPGIKFVCSGSAEPYSCDPTYSITWSILDLNGNNMSYVGSISNAYGGSLSFSFDTPLVGTSNESVKIAISSPGKYVVHAHRETSLGFPLSSFDQHVSLGVDQPQVSVSNLSSDCYRTVSVTNVQEGVAYNWSNSASTSSSISIKGYSSTLVVASATQVCGSQTSQITSSNSVNFPVSNNTSMTITGTSSGNCSGGPTGKIFSVSATSCTPFTSWSWSASTGSVIGGNAGSDAGTSSSNRTYSVSGTGTINVTITGTNPNGSNISGFYTVNCFQGGSPAFLQTSSNGTNGKSLDNVTIDSVHPDISLNTSNPQLQVVSNTFIYPNPSNEQFTVEGLEGIKEVRLINIQGQVLQTHKITGSSTQQNLNVAAYSNGLYFVQLKNSSGEIRTEKVQVSH